MAIYRSQKGNKWHLIIGKRETLRIPILTATRMPPQFTNRQTIMTVEPTIKHNAPFEGALMGFSTVQYLPVELLGYSLPFRFLDSSPRTEHKSRGANVRHRTPRPIRALGLEPQLYGTAHGPNPLAQNWALSLPRPWARDS